MGRRADRVGGYGVDHDNQAVPRGNEASQKKTAGGEETETGAEE